MRRGIRTLPLSLRGAALMPGAAFAVHQLRYRLAFGSDAARELNAQGHAYLTALAPWIGLLVALAVGLSLGRLARRWGSGAAARAGRLAILRVWLAAALALVVIYVGQELLEGWLATGHPGGLAGVAGGGGWWSLLAALLLGGALALALRGERAVDALAAGAAVRLRVPPVTPRLVARSRVAPSLAPPAPLARAAAERAPPRARAMSPA